MKIKTPSLVFWELRLPELSLITSVLSVTFLVHCTQLQHQARAITQRSVSFKTNIFDKSTMHENIITTTSKWIGQQALPVLRQLH